MISEKARVHSLLADLNSRSSLLATLCQSASEGAQLSLPVPIARQRLGPLPSALVREPWLRVPVEAWGQDGARLSGLPTKTVVIETLAAAGERLLRVAVIDPLSTVDAGGEGLLHPPSSDQLLKEFQIWLSTSTWATKILEPAAMAILFMHRKSPEPLGRGLTAKDDDNLRVPPVLELTGATSETVEVTHVESIAPLAVAAMQEVLTDVTAVDESADVAKPQGAAASATASLKPTLFQRAIRNVGKNSAAVIARTVNAAAAVATAVATEATGLTATAAVTMTTGLADVSGRRESSAGADEAPSSAAHYPTVVPLTVALPVPVTAVDLQRYASAVSRLGNVVGGIQRWLRDVASGMDHILKQEALRERREWVDMRQRTFERPHREERDVRWAVACAQLWSVAGPALTPMISASYGHALGRLLTPILLSDVKILTQRYVHKQCDALRRAGTGLDGGDG